MDDNKRSRTNQIKINYTGINAGTRPTLFFISHDFSLFESLLFSQLSRRASHGDLLKTPRNVAEEEEKDWPGSRDIISDMMFGG